MTTIYDPRTGRTTVARPAGYRANSSVSKLNTAIAIGRVLYPYAKKAATATYKYATKKPAKAAGQSMRTSNRSTAQSTSTSKRTSLRKPMTKAAKALKLTKAQIEPVIYRWNAVKNFDDNGFYFLSNNTPIAGTRALPLYLYDLTMVPQNPVGSPLVSLIQNVADGRMAFTPRTGLAADGATATSSIIVEKGYTPGGLANLPLTKTMFESATIKLNCWGCQAKSTTFTVALVQFKEDELVPTHETAAIDLAASNVKRTDFFQSLIKKDTFNPISDTGGRFARSMKVIKQMKFTLDPNSTTDGDADPNVKTIVWSVKFDRLMSYSETTNVLTTAADTLDQADYAVNTGSEWTAQPKKKSRIYLMVRSTNYGADGVESNVLTPSFDVSIRCRHAIAQ